MTSNEHIAISALQHYLYCPRQCALIHIEQQWADNRQTAEGSLLHKRVDSEATRTRRGVRAVTAMPLRSDALGLVGVADVVEISEQQGERRVFPVEYKRGRPKRHRADEVQLSAQALCLEEMLQVRIEAGALFYGKTRRRRNVMFDEGLRALTRDVAAACRTLILSGITPLAHYEPKLCDPCSLKEICRPQRLGRRSSVRSWLHRQLKD